MQYSAPPDETQQGSESYISKSMYLGARSGADEYQMVRFKRGLGKEQVFERVEQYELDRGCHIPVLNRSIDMDGFARKLMDKRYHEFIDWFYDDQLD